MTSIFTKAAAATLIALSGLAALPATASAGERGGFYIEFGDRYAPGGRHFIRDRRPVAACSERQALRKADRFGLYRIHVVRRDHRFVTVSGRKFGHRERVTFFNAPGCPVARIH